MNYKRYLSSLDFDKQRVIIGIHPDKIRYIKYPTPELQTLAVSVSPNVVRYIKHPCEEAQILAVNGLSSTIKFIKNPTKAVANFAISEDPQNIQYIRNPDDETQSLALKKMSRDDLYELFKFNSRLFRKFSKKNIDKILKLNNNFLIICAISHNKVSRSAFKDYLENDATTEEEIKLILKKFKRSKLINCMDFISSEKLLKLMLEFPNL